ncbi:aminotransferase class V-fold PLP-dependent enzyme [Pseudoxanthomonas sp. F37]|uniref:cysteine desulfurase family protein n=1 Tax=Pseudoxanthomonas sp. F37 TaxID=2932492 RepID=UPI001FD620BE|nr:aminotransferase class V-fold PLP-dependent enzyme [Pseudoxanthomonas sp. F37]UOV08554.1 aminotransferase class V-fold PLP-dependent enzyme [Pseudoxanthomonas sp. F37]
MNRIFLDYQSTTPVDPRVVNAMLPYFTEHFGNPHSVEHSFGIQAQAAIDVALARIADVIGATADEIVITSGATEANNLALRGTLPVGKKSHLISAVTEHQSVLGTLAALKEEGHATTLMPVDGEGLIDVAAVDAAIRPTTRIVSVMAVNSEIGVVQPYAELGQLCRSRDVLFHVDAAQGFGRVPLDMKRDCIDLLSVSAHKIYGPKGVGALYVGAAARSLMRAQVTGGGQQGGLRAGTLPTPLIVGFGEASRLMKEERASEVARLADLRKRLWTQLVAHVGGVHLNGSADYRWVGNLNLRFDDVDADSLLLMLPHLAISTGSACTAGTPEPSKVLRALGLSLEQASQSVRIGLGRMTTPEEVDQAVALISQAAARLRG